MTDRLEAFQVSPGTAMLGVLNQKVQRQPRRVPMESSVSNAVRTSTAPMSASGWPLGSPPTWSNVGRATIKSATTAIQ